MPGLLVQTIANKNSSELIRQIFQKHVLAKILTPGEFEFGLGSLCEGPRLKESDPDPSISISIGRNGFVWFLEVIPNAPERGFQETRPAAIGRTKVWRKPTRQAFPERSSGPNRVEWSSRREPDCPSKLVARSDHALRKSVALVS
jgi:hypothetical protein